MINFKSPKYIVTGINKKSNAKYAKGINVGDILEFCIEELLGRRVGVNGHRLGIKSTQVDILVNGEYLYTIDQGILIGRFSNIFELEEINEIK